MGVYGEFFTRWNWFVPVAGPVFGGLWSMSSVGSLLFLLVLLFEVTDGGYRCHLWLAVFRKVLRSNGVVPAFWE